MSTTLSSNNHETKLRDDNTLPAEQEISGEVLLEKYAKGNEQNVHDVRQRVARALAAVEAEDKRAHWEKLFLEAQENGFVTDSGTRMYSHAFATLFFAEVYGMTRRQDVKRALQHELDHLDGLLFLDRLVSRKQDLFARKVYKK